MSRVLKKYNNKVSQKYRVGYHEGIDIIGDNGSNNNSGYLDYIVAHSQGKVISVRSDYKTNDKTGNSYGNYVLIEHDNGYRTLYAHLKYGSVNVVLGQYVLQSEIIGFMDKTGHANGSHLHFEVRDINNKRIDPTPYIDSDLPVDYEKEQEPDKPQEKLVEENTLSDDELLLLVKRTIRGDFGSGQKRRDALGDNFSKVQNQVNLNYEHGTTRWDNVRLY